MTETAFFANAGNDQAMSNRRTPEQVVDTTFEALRRKVPWRPVLLDDTGARPRPRPTALGPQTAIVVGPQGQTSPQGADELYTLAMKRIDTIAVEVTARTQRGSLASYTSIVLVVVVVLAGGSLLGLLGALIAIPVAASILIIYRQVIVPRQNER